MKKSTPAAGILFICLALAVCVCARPEPSGKSDSNVANQAADFLGASLASIEQGVLVGVDVQSSLTLPTPLAVERRSLATKYKKRRRTKLSTGAISGTAAAVILGVCAIILLIIFFIWRRDKKKADPNFKVRDMFRSKNKEKGVDNDTAKEMKSEDKPSN